MPLLENTARADATFGTTQTWDVSTVAVDIPGITILKESDMDVWQGDVLTYTVTVRNIDTAITADGISITDTIDPVLAVLDADSVKLDNTPLTSPDDFTYNPTTGLLTILAVTTMLPSTSHTITFQVTKA